MKVLNIHVWGGQDQLCDFTQKQLKNSKNILSKNIFTFWAGLTRPDKTAFEDVQTVNKKERGHFGEI